MFRPITLKQLNSLTTIDMLSCVCGQEVTHQVTMREIPGSILGSGKDFYVCIFFVFFVAFFWSETRYML